MKKRAILKVAGICLFSVILTGCSYTQKELIKINKDGTGSISVVNAFKTQDFKDLQGTDILKEYENQLMSSKEFKTVKTNETIDGSDYTCYTSTESYNSIKAINNSLVIDPSPEDNADELGPSIFNDLSICETSIHGIIKSDDKESSSGEYISVKLYITTEFDSAIEKTNGKIDPENNKKVTWEINSTEDTEIYAECKSNIIINIIGTKSTGNEDKKIEFSAVSGIKSATLNGKNVETGTVISEEGRYSLIVTDMEGNQKTEIFTIDKTAPIIKGVKNGGFYKDRAAFTFSDNIQVQNVTVNGSSIILDDHSYRLNSDGKYTVVATDKEGNYKKVKFTIDNTLPYVYGIGSGDTFKKPVTIKFFDKNGVKSAKLNGKAIKTGKKVSKKGKYILKVTDKAGNTKTVKFSISK